LIITFGDVVQFLALYGFVSFIVDGFKAIKSLFQNQQS